MSVVIATGLNVIEEGKLLRVLWDNKEAFGWTIHDIKGIDLTIGTRRIHTKEDQETKSLPKRRLNLNMMEVVKGEVSKLLDADIIKPVSDSEWVSLVKCVPKKWHKYHGK